MFLVFFLTYIDVRFSIIFNTLIVIMKLIVTDIIVKEIRWLLLWFLNFLLLLNNLLRVHVHIEVLLAMNWQAIGCSNVNIYVRFAPNHAPDQLVGLLQLICKDRAFDTVLVALHGCRLVIAFDPVDIFKLLTILNLKEGWPFKVVLLICWEVIIDKLNVSSDILAHQFVQKVPNSKMVKH